MAVSGKRGRPRHDDLLTPAEWRIVEAVRHGMSNRTIATRRGISLDAVKYHLSNVLLKLDLPDRAALKHWNGVARSTALFGKEMKLDEGLTLGPIGQIARHVKDIEASRRWYGEVLGLKHLYSFGDLAFFDCGGTRLFLSPGAGEGRARAARIARRRIPTGAAYDSSPQRRHGRVDGLLQGQ